MGNTRITPNLLNYMVEHPGRIVTRPEMVKALGYSEEQIRDNMRNLLARNAPPGLTVVQSAHAWRYDIAETHPDNAPRVELKPRQIPPTKRVFEEVGEIKDGSLILQDEAGKLWKAVEL